jgi:hypothetical protein
MDKIPTGTKCEACQNNWAYDRHHIRSKGSGGLDEAANILFLCRICHSVFHTVGHKCFSGMFPHLKIRIDFARALPKGTKKTTRSFK